MAPHLIAAIPFLLVLFTALWLLRCISDIRSELRTIRDLLREQCAAMRSERRRRSQVRRP